MLGSFWPDRSVRVCSEWSQNAELKLWNQFKGFIDKLEEG